MRIDATGLYYKQLNEQVRATKDADVILDNCLGQRYIGDGVSGKTITINGVPGNGLGAYMNGAILNVMGNAQDATGDTMNDGEIIIHGSSGDATGYGMRGGKIFVKCNAGYRAGIHMKSYTGKCPVLVIGNKAGSFLGEYLSGGLIIVLNVEGGMPVGNFCGTGMHGGKMFLCTDNVPVLPPQVSWRKAEEADLEEIKPYVEEYVKHFGGDVSKLLKRDYLVLTPNTANPYKQLYTHN